MSYATQADMTDRFGTDELIQLTDKGTPPTGTINTAVLDKSLADADATINSYLESRYTLPLSPVPQVLSRIACDIARYFLYDERATEQVRKRYEDALRYLRDVAEERIQLGVQPPQEAPASSGGPQVTAGVSTFSRKSLADYVL